MPKDIRYLSKRRRNLLIKQQLIKHEIHNEFDLLQCFVPNVASIVVEVALTSQNFDNTSLTHLSSENNYEPRDLSVTMQLNTESTKEFTFEFEDDMSSLINTISSYSNKKSL